MKVSELKDFSIPDLEARVKSWKDELFRSRFKADNSEVKDTSLLKKLKRDIARAKTLINQKKATTEVQDGNTSP